MTLKSAFEDLTSTTLASLVGLLAKLEYLADLRQATGEYEHWGLTRVHGERAAHAAISEAHRTVFLKILRTSLKDLHEGAALGGTVLAASGQEYLKDLQRRKERLMPSDLGGGSARHFSSVLAALSALERHSPASTPRA